MIRLNLAAGCDQLHGPNPLVVSLHHVCPVSGWLHKLTSSSRLSLLLAGLGSVGQQVAELDELPPLVVMGPGVGQLVHPRPAPGWASARGTSPASPSHLRGYIWG